MSRGMPFFGRGRLPDAVYAQAGKLNLDTVAATAWPVAL